MEDDQYRTYILRIHPFTHNQGDCKWGAGRSDSPRVYTRYWVSEVRLPSCRGFLPLL